MEKYYDYSKKELLKKYCSSIKKMVLHPRSIINLEKTYYPDAEHKTFCEMFRDQIWHIRKYGIINYDYYIYGLDVKGTDCSKYICEKWNVDNLRHQNRKHCRLAHGHDYIVTVADKALFAQIMQENKFPIPKTYGSLINGVLYLNGFGATAFDLSKILESSMHVLFKPITGNSGKGILSVVVENGKLFLKHQEISLDSFREMTNSGKYLIQHYVDNQHDSMKKLFGQSLNTLRVTMVRTEEGVQLLGCMCLMGGGEAEYSNWHYGGICTSVNEEGRLGKYGFSLSRKCITKHPDSGVVFENYQIPFYKEAVAMCKQAMDVFYGMKTIGWDIAITEEGPIFIEANNGWGIAAHQMVDQQGWAERYLKVLY